MGWVKGIRRYTAEGHPWQLAISLTSTVEARRRELLPVIARTPLPELVASLQDHVAALRARQEGLPAVFITGYAEVSLEGALASGPSELLRKPVSPAELRRVVARPSWR